MMPEPWPKKRDLLVLEKVAGYSIFDDASRGRRHLVCQRLPQEDQQSMKGTSELCETFPGYV